MTIAEVYQQVKYWLPMGSAFGLVIRAYFSIKRGVSEWAESLLTSHIGGIQTTLTAIKNNDLHHLDESMKEIPAALERHTTAITDELKELRADIRAKK